MEASDEMLLKLQDLQERISILEYQGFIVSNTPPNNANQEKFFIQEELMLKIYFIVISAGTMCMFLGLALVELGRVSGKNVKSSIFKHLSILNICVLNCLFSIFSQDSMTTLTGWQQISLILKQIHFVIPALLANGGVTECARHSVAMGIIFLTLLVLCPIYSKWAWCKDGFLYNVGVVDTFGACGIHFLGGVMSFVSSYQICCSSGNRSRTIKESTVDFNSWVQIPSSLGTAIFILSKAFCNAMLFTLETETIHIDIEAAGNTLIAATVASCCSVLWRYTTFRRYKMKEFENIMVSGAVSVSSCCWCIDSVTAMIIGAGTFLIYILASRVPALERIDGPMRTFVTHGLAGGAWGLVAAGLFSHPKMIASKNIGSAAKGGLFRGGGWGLLGAELFSAVIILELCGLVYFVLLFLLRHVFGVQLSVHPDVQTLGLDFVYHDPQYDQVWSEEKSGSQKEYEAARRRSEVRSRVQEVTFENRRFQLNNQAKKPPRHISKTELKDDLCKKASYRRMGSVWKQKSLWLS